MSSESDRSHRASLFASLLIWMQLWSSVQGWTTTPSTHCLKPKTASSFTAQRRTRFLLQSSDVDDDDIVERTSFDQAGKSLIEQEDQKRLEQMGDFDSTDAKEDDVKRMREAIRARTANLGIEKSQVSADYIAMKEAAAKSAGPGGGSDDMFGGLDLSQISDTKMKESSNNDWNDDMPAMFYDPENELTKEEMEEIDPLGTKSFIEQFSYELSQSKLPSVGEALKSVALMLVVFAVSCGAIVLWDGVLRDLYVNVGFLPSDEDMANYAARFDGLDLPEGWIGGLSEEGVETLSDKMNTNIPDAINEVKNALPDL